MSVSDAVDEAMADMRDLKDPYAAHINLIAVDKDGNYAGASYRPGKMFAVIRAGEEKATELNHHNPRPVPGGMETLAYRHNASTDAMGKPKL